MTDFSNAPELIRVENLHKSFGSLHVLNGITDTFIRAKSFPSSGRAVPVNQPSCAA